MKTLLQIIISVLVFISCSNNEKESEILFQELQKSYEKGSELFSEKSDRTKDELKYIISDEVKVKYKEIIPFIEKIEKEFSGLYSLLSKKPFDEIEIDSSIKILISNQKSNYKELLESNGNIFGLRDKDITHLINKNSEKLKDLNFPHLKSSIERNLFASKLKLDLKMLENQLINDLTILTGGNPIGCYFGIMPVVIPSQNFVRRGERFKANIGIIPYDYEFLADDIKLSINGKFVPFDKGRFASYISEPMNANSKKISISCKIRDKRTNKFISAWDNYEYQIKTEK